ncbi:hypothetical protein [Streptomyces sp. MMG1121]|uniref:hypothetical protein n=1 Tax=Streptomyces sp. MMG1121 TaxID=1415544 RepID=UPI00131DBC9E|nr:hypothetical protein [Streptomyces sp. MMG1121]
MTDTNPPRTELVRTPAGLDAKTWRWTNLRAIVRSWGLPAPRQPLRAYAGPAEE